MPCNDAIGVEYQHCTRYGQRRAALRGRVAVADTIDGWPPPWLIAAEASSTYRLSERYLITWSLPRLPAPAAFMLRSRGRDPDRPPRQDRLACFSLAFGSLCASTIVLHVFVCTLRHHARQLCRAWLHLAVVGVPTVAAACSLWFPPAMCR